MSEIFVNIEIGLVAQQGLRSKIEKNQPFKMLCMLKKDYGVMIVRFYHMNEVETVGFARE